MNLRALPDNGKGFIILSYRHHAYRYHTARAAYSLLFRFQTPRLLCQPAKGGPCMNGYQAAHRSTVMNADRAERHLLPQYVGFPRSLANSQVVVKTSVGRRAEVGSGGSTLHVRSLLEAESGSQKARVVAYLCEQPCFPLRDRHQDETEKNLRVSTHRTSSIYSNVQAYPLHTPPASRPWS